MATSSLLAQGPTGSAAIEAHLAAARAAAQQDFLGVYNRLCTPEGATKALIESKGGAPAAPATPRPAATRPPGPPDKSTWAIASGQGLRQPDFVGEKEYSSWAVTTPDGIIVIDTIFEYRWKPGGRRTEGAGLRPGEDQVRHRQPRPRRSFRRREVSPGFLQHPHPPLRPDWDMLETTATRRNRRETWWSPTGRSSPSAVRPDAVRHARTHAGTISTLIPVTDNGATHLAAEWGGTAFNFRPSKERFQTYIDSARRFSDIVAKRARTC